jgi:hypothetical protein
VRAFRREDDALVAEVEPGEREVLATVVADVAELLGGGRLEDRARESGRAASGDDAAPTMRLRLDPLPTPDDPAVHRLLPDASRDDADVAAEFRRLTEDDLRQQKIERLAELFDALTAEHVASEPDEDPADDARRTRRRHRARHAATETVRVPRDRGPALAATLTDVRLVLGERLGVTDERASDALEREVVRGRADDDSAAQARQYLGSVYLALGWWQETLMACLLADLPERPERPERPDRRDGPGRHDGLGSDA